MEYFLVLDLKGGISSVNLSLKLQQGCNFTICDVIQGPVVRSLVSANRWLRGIKTYRFPWYLTLVSANHASSNPGQDGKSLWYIL